jgi:hypothetical protein
MMAALKEDAMLIGVGLAAVLAGAWWLKSNLGNMVMAAPGIVADTAASAVIGTGKVFGIPETNETECEKALREGRTWDASFACPAGTFVRSIFD